MRKTTDRSRREKLESLAVALHVRLLGYELLQANQKRSHLRLIDLDLLLNGVNATFAHVLGGDGQFRDLAERNHRVLVIVGLNGW